MPRRTASEAASTLSSPLSSPPKTPTPTDAAGEPLPVPTTLGTHVLGPRLLRSASRASRGSRSGSAVSSHNPSHTHRNDPVPPDQGASMPSGSSGNVMLTAEEPSPSSGDLTAMRANANPSVRMLRTLLMSQQAQPGRNRRRGYSIRDEMDESELSVLSSASDDYPIAESSRSPAKRKRRTNSNQKATKQRKLNNRRAEVKQEAEAGPSTLPSSSTQSTEANADVEIIHTPLEDITEETPVYQVESSSSPVVTPVSRPPAAEPLAEYSCPICFSPPTNATITPCGHVCCGECLFTAVRSALQRPPGPMPLREPNVARCPVCRATLNGWDGRGGGVIGLRPRTIISL